MTTQFRALPLCSGREPLDASFSRWGCRLGGLGLCGLALLTLWQAAASEWEFVLGTTVSVLDCLLLFLLGALGREVHLAVWNGRAPWHSRRRELLAHAVGLAVLAIGGWILVNASLGVAGALTAALFVLGVYVAILCLGCWSTVAHSRRRSGEAEPDASPNGGHTIPLGSSEVRGEPPSVS